MEEIWKDIEGYEGYQVSNLGNVRSLERVSVYRNSKRLLKGKILKPNRLKDGHLQIFLCKNKICKPYKVHRLVAKAFMILLWENQPF